MDQGAEVLVGPHADAGQGLLSQGVQLDALRAAALGEGMGTAGRSEDFHHF